MGTFVARVSITHAPSVDVNDDKAVKHAERFGAQTKTVNAGEHFDPADVGLSDDDVKRMVARGQIRPVEGDEKPGEPLPMTVRGNETEGSGATRRGTSQIGPPGIDMAADPKDAPPVIRTGPPQVGAPPAPAPRPAAPVAPPATPAK